jgi:hypothetical protein
MPLEVRALARVVAFYVRPRRTNSSTSFLTMSHRNTPPKNTRARAPTPLQETSFFLLVIAAVAQRQGGDVTYLQPYWPAIQAWIEFLVTLLPFPGTQLSTGACCALPCIGRVCVFSALGFWRDAIHSSPHLPSTLTLLVEPARRRL